jgi:hypothetical protein
MAAMGLAVTEPRKGGAKPAVAAGGKHDEIDFPVPRQIGNPGNVESPSSTILFTGGPGKSTGKSMFLNGMMGSQVHVQPVRHTQGCG